MYILLSYLFYFWILTQYFNNFLIPQNRKTTQQVLIWVLFYIAQIALSQITYFLLSFVLNCCCIIFLCYFLYEDSMTKIIFFSISGCFMGMISEIITALILEYLNYTTNEILLAGTCISKLILLLAIYIIKLLCYKHTFASSTPSLDSQICLIFITILSILTIHSTFILIPNSFRYRQYILLFSSIFLSSTNVCCFFLFQKLSFAQEDKNQKRILSALISQYQALSPEKEKEKINFQREKHNLKTQLIAIYHYAQHGQHKEIINFIENILTIPEYGLAPFSICKHLIIDTLIRSKIKVAQDNNISYTYNISVPERLPFNDVDLCILIGNALDNAFEACTAPSSENKYVLVSIKYKKGCLYCHFENSFFHQLQHSSDVFYSTKFDFSHHGFV